MEEEVNSIENNISMLNTKQADIREEITELKSLNNSLKDGITARALELDEITSSVKTLNSQIVSSPERFRKNIIDVGHSLQAEQKDTKLAEKKQRELAGWLTYVEVAQVNVGEALDMMKIVRNEVEKQKSAQQEHNEIKSNTNELKNVLSSLESSVSTIHRQAQRSEEKVNILRQQHNSKISEGNNKINTLHSDILSIENHNNMVKSKADSAENDVIKHERAYNVEIQSNLSEINDMKSTYQRLEKSVLNHLKKFQNTLNQCNGNNHSNEIPPLPAAAVL
jgi:chromosome segregation ATPase